jgi:hypothetical protein
MRQVELQWASGRVRQESGLSGRARAKPNRAGRKRQVARQDFAKPAPAEDEPAAVLLGAKAAGAHPLILDENRLEAGVRALQIVEIRLPDVDTRLVQDG